MQLCNMQLMKRKKIYGTYETLHNFIQHATLCNNATYAPPDGVTSGQNGHVEAPTEGPFMVLPTPSYGQLITPSPPSATGY
jgi:hypothetical protein